MKTDYEKKHIAINTHLLLPLTLLSVFIGMSVAFAVEDEIAESIICGIIALIPIFVLLIQPMYFVFDDDKVKIVYNFGLTETIYWRTVRCISLTGSWFAHGAPPCYVIAYPKKGKMPFFVTGDIPKTRKTKKLIKLYYGKDII